MPIVQEWNYEQNGKNTWASFERPGAIALPAVRFFAWPFVTLNCLPPLERLSIKPALILICDLPSDALITRQCGGGL